MRVCVISHILSLSDGQGRINYAMAERLADWGHDVTLVGSVLEPPLRDHPNVTWVRAALPRRVPTALLKEQVFAWRARRAVLKAARRSGPFDVVQMNGCAAYLRADVNVAMFVHANWIKSPYHTARLRGGAYGMYHRAYSKINALWERRAFSRARAAVAISEMTRRSLIDDVGIDAGRIRLVLPGVNPREFRPLQPGEPNRLRQSLGVPDGALLLLFAGDIRSNRKNLDLVLQALAKLGKGYHLAVAGGVSGSIYPGMAQTLGIAEQVHFLDHRTDLPDLMRCADLFAFPSHYDPFALVVTEAMASGMVPVVGPVVGAASVIQTGENGFVLSASDDLDGLVSVIRQLSDDRARLARMSAAARQTAENLSWDSMARKYESLYIDIAAGKQQERAGTKNRGADGPSTVTESIDSGAGTRANRAEPRIA